MIDRGLSSQPQRHSLPLRIRRCASSRLSLPAAVKQGELIVGKTDAGTTIMLAAKPVSVPRTAASLSVLPMTAKRRRFSSDLSRWLERARQIVAGVRMYENRRRFAVIGKTESEAASLETETGLAASMIVVPASVFQRSARLASPRPAG